MESADIARILPHRYPFLFVDKVESIEGGKVRALKYVSFNEPHFQGHFPDRPIMPGVLILEAMAQAGAFVVMRTDDPKSPFQPGAFAFLAALDGARFRRPVVPGDTLVLEGEVVFVRGRLARTKFTAKVEGELAAEAVLTFAIAAESPAKE
jgi:3-hydroxyacyl-[acyl-carrier-protein] dehydratase